MTSPLKTPRLGEISRSALVAVALVACILGSHFLLLTANGARVSEFVPALNDEIYYWHQAATFREAGFDGGFYTYDEREAAAGWARFYAWGPFIPLSQGVMSAPLRWTNYTQLLLNAALLAAALAAAVAILRPSRSQFALLGAAGILFSPLIRFLPTNLAEATNLAIAIVLGAALASILRREPRRWQLAALVAFILAASLIRITWILILLPVLLFGWRSNTRRGIAVRLVLFLVAAASVAMVFVVTSPPCATGGLCFVSELRAALRSSLSSALHLTWTHLRYNLEQLSTGQTVEIVLRAQVVLTLALGVLPWVVARRRGTKALAARTRDEALAHAVVLGGAILAALLLYEVGLFRDYRLLASFLLFSVVLLIGLSRTRATLVVLLTMAVVLPTTLSAYSDGVRLRFNRGRLAAFERSRAQLSGVIRYQPGAANGWCNTVLTTSDILNLDGTTALALDPGLGISWTWTAGTGPTASPPYRSRYLLFDAPTLRAVHTRLRARELARVRGGRLLINLDSACRHQAVAAHRVRQVILAGWRTRTFP